jgi:hypothetical protein
MGRRKGRREGEEGVCWERVSGMSGDEREMYLLSGPTYNGLPQMGSRRERERERKQVSLPF